MKKALCACIIQGIDPTRETAVQFGIFIKSEEAKIIFEGGVSKKLPNDIQASALRKLRYLDGANSFPTCAPRLETTWKPSPATVPVSIASESTVSGAFASSGMRPARAKSRSWTTTEQENLSMPDYTDRTQWLENPHPGEMLRLDWLEPLGITAYRLAKDTGLAESHVSELVRGKRGITALTAAMLGKYFDTTAEFWMNLQAAYDLMEVRRNHADKIDRIEPCRREELVGA